MAEPELERKLMNCLTELTDLEQNEISMVIAIYSNHCIETLKEKNDDFIKSMVDKISFYGGERANYEFEINQLVERYTLLINKIIEEYDIRMMSVLLELNKTEINQKTAIANMKLSIDMESEIKINATRKQKTNYEIVIQECFRQLDNIWNECKASLNVVDYNKSSQLIVNKTSLLQKILNIFIGKKSINSNVFTYVEMELRQLEKRIKDELKKVEKETINNIAIIQDAQTQAKMIFQEML